MDEMSAASKALSNAGTVVLVDDIRNEWRDVSHSVRLVVLTFRAHNGALKVGCGNQVMQKGFDAVTGQKGLRMEGETENGMAKGNHKEMIAAQRAAEIIIFQNLWRPAGTNRVARPLPHRPP